MEFMEYEIIRTKRKTISISVKEDGSVVVRAPKYAANYLIDRFVREKEAWIKKAQHKQLERAKITGSIEKLTPEEIKQYSKIARERIEPVLEEYARKLNVTYNRVTIRAQHTRWGSCSSKGNLNFNCLLAVVPDSVLRYIVAHEVCHLVEMNHSTRFWAKVEFLIPRYTIYVKWLQDEGSMLMKRLP